MNDADLSLYDELVHDARYLDVFKGVPIFGITGTNGGGKDTLMDLMGTEGFLTFNAGDSLRQITKAVMGTTQRGGNDSPVGSLANRQRSRYPGGMVELALIDWWVRVAHLEKDLQPRGLVIGSIRGANEVKRLHEVGGKLIMVDADPHIRFERLKARGRHYEQDITFEQFLEEEKGEMGHGETDPTKFSMAQVIEMADLRITNDGTYEEFLANINHTLKEIGVSLSLSPAKP